MSARPVAATSIVRVTIPEDIPCAGPLHLDYSCSSGSPILQRSAELVLVLCHLCRLSCEGVMELKLDKGTNVHEACLQPALLRPHESDKQKATTDEMPQV